MSVSPLATRMLGAGVALALSWAWPPLAAGDRVPLAIRSVIIWQGGDGPWSGMWLAPPEPQFNDPVQFWIDGNNPVNSSVFLDVDVQIVALTIDSGDALYFMDGRSLTLGELSAGYLTNSGLIVIHAESAISRVVVGGGMLHITGAGAIEMDHSFCSRIVAIPGQSATCTNATTIRGAGIIGDGNLRLVNQGLISADRELELLHIQPDAVAVTNNGIMQARNGGALVLLPGAYDNVGGHIVAHDQSYVDIDGALISGGTLNAVDQGIVRAHVHGPHFTDLTTGGRIELGLVRLTLSGAITNDGEIEFVPEGMIVPTECAELFVPAGVGDVTLSGDGEVILTSTKVLSDAAPAPRLINDASHTIRGEGLIGTNSLALQNFGAVVADRDDPLVFDPPDSPETVNEGTLRAIGLGGFVITNGTFRNNGTIEVMPGSRCFYTATASEANVASATLAGGTWRVIAGDQIAFIHMAAPPVFYNTADVLLSGSGASFTAIDSMLVNAGRFAIDDDRDFTTQGAFFSNEGELVIGKLCQFAANGAFSQIANAVLEMQVSGENLLQENASLQVAGVATLGGTLRLTVAPGVELIPGQTLHLITAGSIAGQFSAVIAPPNVQIRYELGQVVADVVGVCAGDVTGDGTVGAADLFFLISQWGECPLTLGNCTGDLTGDGAVDVADMLVLIDAWGDCD